MSEIPRVTILAALRPDLSRDAGEPFRYSNLAPTVERHRLYENARLARVWDEVDALKVNDAAQEAAKQYLLMTSQRLQEVADPSRAQLLSERFTQASIELFGAPTAEVAAPLLVAQYAELAQYTGPNASPDLMQFLKGEYESIFGNQLIEVVETTNEQAEKIRTAAEQIGAVIKERFADAMAFFDGDDSQIVSAAEVADRFERALEVLKNQDAAWQNQRIDRTDDTRMIARSEENKIDVGLHRAPSTLKEIRGLFVHEALLHTYRKVNADRRGDLLAAKGLPGYLDAEEGAGTFFEYAITGVIPVKNTDRYGDIALALGVVGDRRRPRKQLYDFVLARSIIREQMHGDGRSLDIDILEDKSKEHVDRIYRGSKGDEYVGIFTKDIAYHKGFVEIADYVVRELERGVSIERVFDFLVSGKFDPNNELHVEYIGRRI